MYVVVLTACSGAATAGSNAGTPASTKRLRQSEENPALKTFEWAVESTALHVMAEGLVRRRGVDDGRKAEDWHTNAHRTSPKASTAV
jgi:hypothetical protein